MSTKEMPGPFDGMERAKPGEPVFTLRAHDPLAPALVLEWADCRRKAIRTAFEREEITEAKRALELIQCKEAEELAWSMDAWRKGELAELAAKLEDAPAVTYSGNAKSEEELAAKARYDAIKAACQLLNNAVAGATDAAKELLSKYGLVPERAVILTAVERIKAVSSHLTPKRASYAVGDPEPEPFDLSFGIINGTHLRDAVAELEGEAKQSPFDKMAAYDGAVAERLEELNADPSR